MATAKQSKGSKKLTNKIVSVLQHHQRELRRINKALQKVQGKLYDALDELDGLEYDYLSLELKLGALAVSLKKGDWPSKPEEK